MGNRTRDLPACSIVLQTTMLPCGPLKRLGRGVSLAMCYLSIRVDEIVKLQTPRLSGIGPEAPEVGSE
jgi:hypothetical protein